MLSKLRNIKWPGNADTEKNNDKKSQGVNPNTEQPATNSNTVSGTQQSDFVAALNDPSEKKRIQACNQVKDHEKLLQVALTDSSDNVRLIAGRQYAKHLPVNDSARGTVTEFATSADKKHLARLISAHSSDAELRNFGLTHFSSDEDLYHIATEARYHDTRQSVAASLNSLEMVDKCWRALKSKDKVVARELKLRLDAKRSENDTQKQREQEIEKIIDEMDKLANGAWSPQSPTRYELFAGLWQQLDYEIPTAKKERYAALQTLAAERVDRDKAEQQAKEDFDEVINALKSANTTLLEATFSELTETLPQIDTTAEAQKNRWLQLISAGSKSAGSVDEAVEQQYQTHSSRLRTHIQQAKDITAACTELDDTNNVDTRRLSAQLKKLQSLHASIKSKPPRYTDELPQFIEKIQHTIDSRARQSKDLKAAINKQFGSLASAVSAKKWGPAKSIHERVAKKIARLPEAEQKPLRDKLERHEQKLRELGDWKQFATEPKLVELCEQMEQVPSLGIALKDQADRVKELQRQWKAMGASPGQETHWPRFKKAADTAYEPCAEYFAQQRNIKQGKLKQRSEICDMLQTYLDKSDWQKPDLNLVEKTIRTAKSEWRDNRVFDRKATAALDARFTDILNQLEEKLQPLYESSISEKQELIDKAVALGEGDINQHCVNQIKRLQGMWRLTGKTRRKDDQKLWTAFNDACSKVYQTHRGNQREQYAASVEHVTRAKAIISELKALTKSDSAPDEQQIQQLQDEFAGLAEFPERDQKYLSRDLARALDAIDNHRQKATATAQKMELDRLGHNAAICEKLENLAGQPGNSINEELERLTAEWNSGEKTDNPRWKKSMQSRLDTAVAHLQAGTEPDYQANTQAKRLLCIETEILTERETPASDKQLRMQYQLDKLQQGLSSASAISPQQLLLELKMKWLASLPAHPDQQASLQQRFETASADR